MKTIITLIKYCSKIFILCIGVFALESCSHYYYAPNMHNVPMFQKKGDGHISLSGSMGCEFKGTELQAAFAVDSSIGVMANGFFAREQEPYNGNSGNGSYFEAGGGYFKPVGKHFVFETYGGAGYGNVRNIYGDLGNSRMGFVKYFLQPSFGITSKNFDMVLSARFCDLNYCSIQDHTVTEGKDDIYFINDNKVSLLAEPALTIRLGWNNFKFQFQYVMSKNLDYDLFPQETVNLSMGIFVSFK